MPWYEYSSLGGKKPLPVVEVLLWHGSRRIRLAALVDSGADSSLLDLEVALAVGLDEAKAVKGSAITAGGGAMEVLSWPKARLELQFEGDRFPFKGEFARFVTGNDGVSLLGRSDFFDRYVVSFWEADGILNIDSSPYRAHPPIGSRKPQRRRSS
jgi:hypothetical protein